MRQNAPSRVSVTPGLRAALAICEVHKAGRPGRQHRSAIDRARLGNNLQARPRRTLLPTAPRPARGPPAARPKSEWMRTRSARLRQCRSPSLNQPKAMDALWIHGNHSNSYSPRTTAGISSPLISKHSGERRSASSLALAVNTLFVTTALRWHR